MDLYVTSVSLRGVDDSDLEWKLPKRSSVDFFAARTPVTSKVTDRSF